MIGIGGSAGSLQAVGDFFEAMPPDSGMAFVVVQHLQPDKESMVAEILARKTAMPVRQVSEGMSVEPNCVYVILPGHTLTLRDGILHLGPSVERRGNRRPVDDFFRSLAAEQSERSIVIVMSGMGTNGTAGAQAIKAAGGICIAQDPQSAEFASMPLSVIDAGYADYVLAPKAMPEQLLSYARHPYYRGGEESRALVESVLQHERHHFHEVLAILRGQTKRDFAVYKKPTLLRRMQRRMGLAQVTTLAEYVDLLRARREEAHALADDLMINVTGFFRDPEAWEALRAEFVAPLLSARSDNAEVRAWVAGCASGEEAYTLAMLLTEESLRLQKRFDVKIFASDTAERILAHARAGMYPGGIEGEISAERLERFFEKDGHSFRIRKEFREMVVFAPQNLLTDPPFSRLDLCTCRNLLIYLEPATQRNVISLLHFALREGGCLFLGNSETLGPGEDLFVPINKQWRIYRRIGGATRHAAINFPAGPHPDAAASLADASAAMPRPALAATIQRALVEHHSPALAVIDRQQRVVYFQGRTDRYLLQPGGEPTRNIIDMTREGLRPAVRRLVRSAIRDKGVSAAEVPHDGGAPGAKLRVAVAPLADARVPDHFVVSFNDAGSAGPVELGSATTARPGKKGTQAAAAARDDVEEELRSVREELQSTIEELESSNEELKASNEEVTSINEELQSTNEELETSKEELQSLNEELLTVNSQLQSKVEALEAITNDLSNLLSSTSIAVVFLDTRLRIRRFTPAVRDLMEVIPSDIGRPVADLAQKFEGGDLLKDAQAVLDRLVPIESQVRSHSGRWYLRRALPYRTADNRIDGVVLTFVDITDRKLGEDAIRESRQQLQTVLEQMPAAVIIAEAPSGRLVLGNTHAAALFGHPFPLPFLDTEWAAAYVAFKGFHQSGRPYQRDEWPLARALNEGREIVDEEIRFVRPDGSRGTMSASAAPVRAADGKTIAAVATFWDISERTQVEQSLRESERRFRLLVEGAQFYAIVMLDPQGAILTWNSGAQRLFGYTEAEALGQSVRMLYALEDRTSGAPERELALASQADIAPDDRWLVRKDGSKLWCSGTLSVLRSDAGALKGYLKILRDMTEVKRTQAGLQEAMSAAESSRELAEAANRAKDDFVATVSHELRTPLTAILLWARILRGRNVSGKMLEQGMATVERAAKAQQQLVDDLLDVSRISSGKLKLSVRATRLTDAIKSAIEAVKPAADARGLQLDSGLAADIGIVRADPDRVQQIIWNLLSNAVKFTPSGGRVELRAWRREGDVIVRVADTGIGIRPDFLPFLFDRFRQADVGSTREHAGLGLGLAIARQLAELHGGTLTCNSDGEGRGATFTATLPLARLREDVEIPTEHGLADVNLSGRHILLVEDEGTTRDAIDALLREQGAAVTAVDSAKAALDVLPIQGFDLIISDIAMPEKDGYSLIRDIRSREEAMGTKAVPALALSAFARQEDQRRATELGFHAYLVKPVTAERLLSVLHGLLDGS